MAKDQINLSFSEGMLFARMDAFLAGARPAATLFNGPYYFAEQLGFRKIIDTTFMVAAMINGAPEMTEVGKRALRSAQRDIDVRPELYTHFYRREFPERFHARMDPRRWGPGERIVFEPYSREAFSQSFEWIAEHAIFERGNMGAGNYDRAVVSIDA